MDANKVKQIISKIVKEELEKILPSMLEEHMRGNVITETKRVKTVAVKTGNPAIDKILAETNIDTFGDRSFSRNNQSVMIEGVNQKIGSKIPIPDTDVNGIPLTNISPDVVKTLDRDFSAILKKSMTIKRNG
jgi:hypothetical protein